jgi:DNA adenine methylase
MPSIEPFLRWAGGKTWLTKYIQDITKNLHIEHYHEPFLGGGAIFFALEHEKKSYLSDANVQLINTYIQVKDNPKEVISSLRELPNTKSDYYKIRAEISYTNTAENAAKFIYLNQTSFNGLYRVNSDGFYNVPYGFRDNWVYDENRIILASEKLKNTRIEAGDFELNKHRIKARDLVFLDPPYTVSHNNNGFVAYNQNIFSLEDQYRLKEFIECLKNRGAYYILTNAAHKTIKEIFLGENDRIIEMQRNSLIGGKNAKRAMISEYIFTNIPGE